MRNAIPMRSTTRRRGLLLLTAALAVAACSTSGTQRPKQVETRSEGGFTITEEVRVGLRARSDFDEALERLEEEDYERAIALLLEFTEAAPQVTAGHVDLGMAYARKGELENAEASLARALELNPDHPVALNELGIVYRRTGRFQEARKSYERALAEHPDFHFARLNLAILCDTFLDDPRCAIEHYELYMRADPDDKTTAMWIADLRNRLEE